MRPHLQNNDNNEIIENENNNSYNNNNHIKIMYNDIKTMWNQLKRGRSGKRTQGKHGMRKNLDSRLRQARSGGHAEQCVWRVMESGYEPSLGPARSGGHAEQCAWSATEFRFKGPPGRGVVAAENSACGARRNLDSSVLLAGELWPGRWPESSASGARGNLDFKGSPGRVAVATQRSGSQRNFDVSVRRKEYWPHLNWVT